MVTAVLHHLPVLAYTQVPATGLIIAISGYAMGVTLLEPLQALAIALTLAAVLGFARLAIVTQRLQKTNRQLKQSDRTLRMHNEQFHAALGNMTQGLTMYDSNHRLIVSNARYCEITGVAPTTMRPGQSFLGVLAANKALGNFPGKNIEEIWQERLELVARGVAHCSTQELANGRIISLHFEPMPSGGWVATYSDITEEKRAEARIRHMANHDALTGLPNRNHFLQALKAEIDAGGEQELSLLYLDLDGFKAVNDTHGHLAGDDILKAVAGRLSAAVREGDSVARLGGDEFAVMMPRTAGPDTAAMMADRLIETLGAEYSLGGLRVRIGASVGIARAPADGTAPNALLKSADSALYRAKAAGRGRYRFFGEAEVDAAPTKALAGPRLAAL